MTGEFIHGVAKIVAKIAAIYDNVKPTKEVVAIWVEVLDGVELEKAEKAAMAFMRGADSFPTPGKIRTEAVELCREARRNACGIDHGNGLTTYGELPKPMSDEVRAVFRSVMEKRAAMHAAENEAKAELQRKADIEFHQRRVAQIAALRALGESR